MFVEQISYFYIDENNRLELQLTLKWRRYLFKYVFVKFKQILDVFPFYLPENNQFLDRFLVCVKKKNNEKRFIDNFKQ